MSLYRLRAPDTSAGLGALLLCHLSDMHVLVAEDDFATRVMMETALRERGLSVRNCEDGLEAARMLSAPGAPRMAVLSNRLKRLRGLDISRFLSALGKKTGVYIVLVADSVDMELLELCRRAGVDDVVRRSVSPAGFASRLNSALRTIALEDELARIQGALKGLAAFETCMDRRANELKEANSALLKNARGGEAAAQPVPPAPQPAARPSARTRSAAPAQAGRGHIRSLNIGPDSAAAAAPAHRVPSDMPGSRDTAAPPGPLAAAMTAPAREVDFPVEHSEAHAAQHAEVLSSAASLQDAELAEDETDRIVHPFEFDEILLSVFAGMGVTLKTQIPPKPIDSGPLYVAWVGIGMPRRGSWLDVLLVAGETAAQELTKAMLGQAVVTSADVCEMLAELENITQGSLRRHLEEKGHSLVQLAIPRAREEAQAPPMPTDQLVVDSGFTFLGEAVNAYLFEHNGPIPCDGSTEPQLYDMICDDVADASGKAVEGLRSGTLLREKQLRELRKMGAEARGFRIVRPSIVASSLRLEALLA